MSLLIDAMNLKNVLCQIYTNCFNLHIGRSYLFVGIHIRHFGTMMPFKVGATIPLACGVTGRYLWPVSIPAKWRLRAHLDNAM